MNIIKPVGGICVWFAIVVLLVSMGQAGLSDAASERDDFGWVLARVTAASNMLALVEKAHPDGGAPVIDALMALGKARMDALDYAGAGADFQRAIDLHQDAFKNLTGKEDIRHDLLRRVRLLSARADTELMQNQFEEAARIYAGGLGVAKLGLSPSIPEVRHLRTGRAVAFARQSVNEVAESLLEQLLRACERSSGYVHEDVALVLNQQIEFMALTGRLKECKETAFRLVDVLQRVYGSDHPMVAEALNRLASARYENGNLETALPPLKRALSIRRAAFGASHEFTRRSERNIESLEVELGKQEAE